MFACCSADDRHQHQSVRYGIAAALPVFRKQGFGHFVNTASTAGRKTVPNQSVYPGTKFAVRAGHPEQVRLLEPFVNGARPNRRKVRLGIAQRGGRCVDRVGAEDEVILVRDGRAENEFSVGSRLEPDCFARWLESRQVAAP